MHKLCHDIYNNSELEAKGMTIRSMKLSDIIGLEGDDKSKIGNNLPLNNMNNKGASKKTSGSFPKIWYDQDKNNPTIAVREQQDEWYTGQQAVGPTTEGVRRDLC